MTYSKLYFNKELIELNFEDIEKFFKNERVESDKIEFKSYHNPLERNHTEKENGIIRAICGLLNSEGGIVIWGAPIGEKTEGKTEKIFKGILSPIDISIEKDSFISRVTDLITPSPSGIKIQVVLKGNSNICVIEVEKSFYAPHQFRNIYYMRIDGQTKPAPHHYIEALFRKVTFPKLEGYLKIDKFSAVGNTHVLWIKTMIFNMSKLQNEYDINYRVIVTVGKFDNFGKFNQDPKRTYNMDGHEFRALDTKSTLYYNEPLSNTEAIVFETEDLLASRYKCEILFYFGGKQSPLMLSRYELLLTNADPLNTNNLIFSFEENQFTHDISNKNEIGDRERIRQILGR